MRKVLVERGGVSEGRVTGKREVIEGDSTAIDKLGTEREKLGDERQSRRRKDREVEMQRGSSHCSTATACFSYI